MGGQESTLPVDVEKARPPLPREVPQSARSLIALANRLGWKNQATFARGFPAQKNGIISETMVDSLVVKLQAPKTNDILLRAVVYWEDNSVSFTYYLDGTGWHHSNMVELKKLLQSVDR